MAEPYRKAGGLGWRLQDLLAARTPVVTRLTENSSQLECLIEAYVAAIVDWQVPATADLSAATAVFAFSFGQGSNQTPGRVNMALARWVEAVAQARPVLAQWEVAAGLAECGAQVAYTAVPQNGYLSTRGVLAQFGAFLPAQEQAIIIIAHPDHAPRCCQLVAEAGYRPLFPAEGKTFIKWATAVGCDSLGYDPDSTQPWTRSREAFVAYELAIRCEALRPVWLVKE